MDENLPRWIFASLNKHFSLVAADLGVAFHVEGVDEDEAFAFTQNNILFRLNGPFADPGSGVELYGLETQILLTHLSGPVYDLHVWGGRFLNEMLKAIPLFRFGDDDSLIGCLNPDWSSKNPIRFVNYGEVDRDLKVKQASVNGKHTLEI